MIHYMYVCYFRPVVEAFRAPDKATLAGREFAEAERCLLTAQSGLEFAKAMVTYQAARVTRLGKILAPKPTTKEINYERANARPPVQRVH